MEKLKGLQEVYSEVRKHLLTQGVPAMNSDDSCQYRNNAGLKCAIGALITDEAYTPDIEGRTIDLGWNRLKPVLAHSGVDVELEGMFCLLGDLQVIHDLVVKEDWEAHLNSLARNHNLQPV